MNHGKSAVRTEPSEAVLFPEGKGQVNEKEVGPRVPVHACIHGCLHGSVHTRQGVLILNFSPAFTCLPSTPPSTHTPAPSRQDTFLQAKPLVSWVELFLPRAPCISFWPGCAASAVFLIVNLNMHHLFCSWILSTKKALKICAE